MSDQPSSPGRTQFGAPWSRQLKLLTLMSSAILLGISIALLFNTPANAPAIYQLGIWIPVIAFVLGALFAVRGYQLVGDQLYVLRPGWRSSVSLKDLQSVTADPQAMDGSIRLFGNGGLFGYLGLFRNNKLGRYRVFATDAARSVILRFPAKTWVITPDDPQVFVQATAHLAGKS